MQDTDTLQLETISLERPHPGIAVASLNRPDRRNGMTVQMFHDIRTLGRELRDDTELRALVVTGAGSTFCAGFDLAEIDVLGRMSIPEFLAFQELATGGLASLRSLHVPVIMAVNGDAAGGGFSLSLVGDIRIGDPSTTFNLAFVRVGLSAGELGTSWLLSRLIGPGRAAELAYTGRKVLADEAERIGLLNHVVPADRLRDEALAMAERIVANAPSGVQLSKRALHANQEVSSYGAALELENRGQALLSRGDDMSEAFAAIKERRKPQFTGR